MDYRRLYWLCFLVGGAVFGLLNGADYASAGAAADLVLAVAGAAIVIVAAFGIAVPERVGGPERPGPRFAVAVVALLLFLGLALRRLLGL